MSRILLLAAPLLAFFSCAALGAPGPDVYAAHCSAKDVIPETISLDISPGGKLLWNGATVTSKEFESYLTDVIAHTKGENIYFFFSNSDSLLRPNIVAALKKHGMIHHPECHVPPPIP